MKKILHTFKDQRGSVFVMGVLIMAIITAIALISSSLGLSQLQFSTNLDNAIFAYYGAASGIERGLYETRKLDITQANVIDQPLGNGVLWSRDVDFLSETVTFENIEKNKTVQLDLFDPEFPACDGPFIRCNFNSMKLEWDTNAFIEVSYTGWETGPFIEWNTSEQFENKLINSQKGWVINDFVPDTNYRVKIKPLYEDIDSLTVTFYEQDNAQGDIVHIPNYLQITGSGAYKNSKQDITVNIARKAPLSALFDYVIFTEDDLVKEF